MAKTLRERYVVALEGQGWQRDLTSRSGKYLVYHKPEVSHKLYIGKSGSLRLGTTVAGSIPVSDKRKQQILG